MSVSVYLLQARVATTISGKNSLIFSDISNEMLLIFPWFSLRFLYSSIRIYQFLWQTWGLGSLESIFGFIAKRNCTSYWLHRTDWYTKGDNLATIMLNGMCDWLWRKSPLWNGTIRNPELPWLSLNSLVRWQPCNLLV